MIMIVCAQGPGGRDGHAVEGEDLRGGHLQRVVWQSFQQPTFHNFTRNKQNHHMFQMHNKCLLIIVETSVVEPVRDAWQPTKQSSATASPIAAGGPRAGRPARLPGRRAATGSPLRGDFPLEGISPCKGFPLRMDFPQAAGQAARRPAGQSAIGRRGQPAPITFGPKGSQRCLERGKASTIST